MKTGAGSFSVQQAELFVDQGLNPPCPTPSSQMGKRNDLHQYFTPEWAADQIVRTKFAQLSADDLVIDAGCGRGAFLKAIPEGVQSIGVELDPELAAIAREECGRPVVVGDFRTVPLPTPTLILGNPPFSHDVAEGFLRRAADLLPEDGRCGFILPASFLSFASSLTRWNQEFSIELNLLPRNLFPRIRDALAFFLFQRERVRRLHGFLLFNEAQAVSGAPKHVRIALVRGRRRKNVWRVAVEEALSSLGGRASLSEIYNYMGGRLPRTIEFWKDTVRRVLQEGGFENLGRGLWAFPQTVTPRPAFHL